LEGKIRVPTWFLVVTARITKSKSRLPKKAKNMAKSDFDIISFDTNKKNKKMAVTFLGGID